MKAAHETSRIAIVGAGLLGLTMAWRLARAGRRVDLCESDEEVVGLARVVAGSRTSDAAAAQV